VQAPRLIRKLAIIGPSTGFDSEGYTTLSMTIGSSSTEARGEDARVQAEFRVTLATSLCYKAACSFEPGRLFSSF
jgi:hypothetical protein